jgi:hypothetical protein
VDQVTIDYQLINHGKTPAIITAMSADFHHWTELPSEILYLGGPLSGEIVVRTGEIYPPPVERAATGFEARIAERTGIAPPTHIFYQNRRLLSEPLDAESVHSIQDGGSFL